MDTKSRQAEGLTPQQAPAPGGRPVTAPPKKRRNPLATLLWAAVFALIVVGIVIFALTRGGGSQTAGPGGRHGRGGPGGAMGAPTTVSVLQVGRGDVPIYLNELGTVTPLATVNVTSEISGYLQSLGFTEGQMVRKGQFLAQIDPRPYQAALLQAEGALARDQAALAEAEVDLKRYRLLLSQDSIASQQVDLQAATVLQDQGTVKTDQAAIVSDKLNIAYAHVTSPVTGRAGLRQIDVGNYVTAISNVTNATNSTTATGSSGIVVVTQLTPIDVEFTLPEDNLPQVQARLHTGADAAGGRLRPDRHEPARHRQAAGAGQPGRSHHRHGEGQGAVRERRRHPVPPAVRQRARAGRHPAQRGHRLQQRGAARRQRTVRLCRAGGDEPPHRHGEAGEDRRDGRDQHRHPLGRRSRRDRGHRRHRPAARGRGGDPAGRLHPRLRRSRRPWRPSPPCRRGSRRPGRRGGPNQGGCPRGETRESAAGAKAGADASSGSGSVGGPGATGQSSADSGNSPEQPAAGQGQQGLSPGQNQGGRTQAMLAPLNLDAQQQLKAQALFTAARGEAMTSMANSGDDPAARHQAMHAAYDKAFGQLDAILRPDQKARLAQIRAQMAADRAKRQGGGDQ